MDNINHWLAFDGFFVKFAAGSDTFFRFNYQYMLYPNGEPVDYQNNNIDLYQDGNLIPTSNFVLIAGAEDYIILTISYPVESNE